MHNHNAQAAGVCILSITHDMSASEHEKDNKEAAAEVGDAAVPEVVDEAAFKRALFKLDVIFLPVITLIYVRGALNAMLTPVPQLPRRKLVRG